MQFNLKTKRIQLFLNYDDICKERDIKNNYLND